MEANRPLRFLSRTGCARWGLLNGPALPFKNWPEFATTVTRGPVSHRALALLVPLQTRLMAMCTLWPPVTLGGNFKFGLETWMPREPEQHSGWQAPPSLVWLITVAIMMLCHSLLLAASRRLSRDQGADPPMGIGDGGASPSPPFKGRHCQIGDGDGRVPDSGQLEITGVRVSPAPRPRSFPGRRASVEGLGLWPGPH
jgi:hypothetical protein